VAGDASNAAGRQSGEVEVRFVAEAPDPTRLELEHRYIHRRGDAWERVPRARPVSEP